MSFLGIHEKALLLREARSEILSSNLVNADTPNFKARDLDFAEIFSENLSEKGVALDTTSKQHIKTSETTNGVAVKYRTPTQHAMDGNTVDPQVEQAEYAANSLRYLSTLNFIKSKINHLSMALKTGE